MKSRMFYKERMNFSSDFLRLKWVFGRYAKPRWRLIALLLLSNFGVVVATMLLPGIIAPLIDLSVKGNSAVDDAATASLSFSLQGLGVPMLRLLPAHSSIATLMISLASAYVLVAFARGGMAFLSYLVALRLRVTSTASMQLDLYSHILKQPMAFFANQRAGELISRLDNDINSATYGFEGIFIPLCVAPPVVAFYGFLMYQTSPALVVAGAFAFFFHYAVSKFLMRKIRSRLVTQFAVLGDFKARLHEVIVGVRVVKAFGAENVEVRRMQKLAENLIPVQMNFGKWKHMEAPLREALNHALEIGFLAIAASALHDNVLDTSSFLMFVMVGKVLMAPLGQLAGMWTIVQTMLASLERVFELLAVTSGLTDGQVKTPLLEKEIRFKDVCYEYVSGVTVLSNVNLTIAKGQMVALVGASGSGKSTLADVLLRFMEPSSGCVYWDENPISSFSRDSYMAAFGVVPQEPYLFNMSVADNISYGRRNLSRDDIVAAAKLANAHDFICALPRGYDTEIGERGVMLSGGQKQRLCIARAVVGKPQILVLDEATSSLDSSSETQVQLALERSIRGATALVIAHRLSTIRRANLVVMLDQGEIVATGSYEELLDTCSSFRVLHDLQFSNSERDGVGVGIM